MIRLSAVLLVAALLGCNNSSSDKGATKDSTVVSKTDSSVVASKTDANQAPPKIDSVAKQALAIDPVKYPGGVAYAVFQQDGNTLFYYNVDTKKGSISINGKKYDFDSYNHQVNEPDYTLKSGGQLSIEVKGTKYHDYANPEPGIMKGKAASVVITMGTDKLELKNVDVVDGTNAD